MEVRIGHSIGRPCRGEYPPMKRTYVLATLWFFAGWVIGAMTAFLLGLPELMAPIAAVAAALIAYRPAWLMRTWRPTRMSVASHPR